MRRLTREQLTSTIFVAIVTAPPTIQRGLVSKDRAVQDRARRDLTDRICGLVDGRGVCVVKADPVRVASDNPGHHVRAGSFGEDEPWPAETDSFR